MGINYRNRVFVGYINNGRLIDRYIYYELKDNSLKARSITMARHVQLVFFSAAWWLLLWAQCVSTLRFTRGDFPDGFAFGAATSAYQVPQ